MSNSIRQGKYANYAFEVGRDIDRDGWYEHREGGDVLKIHYRAYRVPSKKKFVIRHYAWASETERAEAERVLLLLPRIYPIWEADGRARRRRHSEGHYYWTAPCGSILDDPLIQLEFEMLADQSTGASSRSGMPVPLDPMSPSGRPTQPPTCSTRRYAQAEILCITCG